MADRAHVLGQLQGELTAAELAGDVAGAALLRVKIAALSQGSPANPATETTAATRPARSKE